MRTVNVVFENEEFELLTKTKGKRSWHDFILEMTGVKKDA